MGYGKQLDSAALKGSEFAPRLTKPYLGPAKLLSGGSDTVGKDSQYKVIKFTFLVLDPDLKGVQHEHAIFEPDSSDEEKVDKMRARVAHILKYFVGEEMALSAVNAATSFDNLGTNVTKALERTEAQWKDKEVSIKVLGSVYNGKARLDFPAYLGFIADEESAAALAWGRRELSDNAQYLAALETPATSSTEVEGSPVAAANTF